MLGTDKDGKEDTLGWLGVAYWPLKPFSVYLNEVVLDDALHLRRDDAPNAVTLPIGALDDIKRYWDYFLLLEPGRSEPAGTKWPFLEATADGSPYGTKLLLSQVKEVVARRIGNNLPALRSYPDSKRWQACLGVLPQHEKVEGLALKGSIDMPPHKFLHARKPEPFLELSSEPLPQFYIDTEFKCGQHFVDGPSSIPEFRELSETSLAQSLLPKPTSMHVACRSFCITSSFFADGVIDIIFFLTLGPGPNEVDAELQSLASGFQGAAYSLRTRRCQWLYDWIERLKQRVSSEMADSGNELAAKQKALGLVQNAIISMTYVLMGTEQHCSDFEEAVGQWRVDVLDEEKDWTPRNVEHVKGVLEQCHPQYDANQPQTRDQCAPRARYVAGLFTIPAYDAVAQAIRGLSQGKLKGSLAWNAKVQLRERACNSPKAARLLLLGPPGGGKGAASYDYHLYSMERLAKFLHVKPTAKVSGEDPEKKTQNSLERNKEWSTAITITDEGKAPWNKKPFQRYIKSIAERLHDLITSPSFRRLTERDDTVFKAVIGACKEQLEGTAWWKWHPGMSLLNECPYQQWFDRDGTPDVGEPNGGFMGFLANAVGLDKTNKPDVNDAGVCAKLAIAGYLSHFVQHLFYVRSFPEDERDWSFNFVQITCGTLGSDGDELRVALRQLFGEAGGEGGTVPGLFQICSYMGGTLFLDEIADAPVKIQDNLLMPLEEKKVFRSGWETLKESVDNVRIVAATFKDLRAAATQFNDTLPTGRPQGFRPDLLTRLAGTPPVIVGPIYDYFLYDEEGRRRSREQLRLEFVSIMKSMSRDAEADQIAELSRFWPSVYDDVDHGIDNAAEAQHRFAAGMTSLEKRKAVASKLSMRFFKFMSDTLNEALEDDSDGDSKELQSRMANLRNDYIPLMLTYLLYN